MDNDTKIDPNQATADPEGQQPQADQGNDQGQGDQGQSQATTDFLELEGVRVPKQVFEKYAKEQYKDAFDALENRSKWQAANTQEAMRLKQLEREAFEYRRLMADPRSNQQTQPRNEYESLKEEYIREQAEFYPDADPNQLKKFLGKQFDWNAKLAGHKAQETMMPIQERQAMEFEEKFLAAHPKLQKGSDQYNEIRDLVGQGVNPEKAYQIVFFDDLLKERESEAIKKRDEEAKRKLQQSRTVSTTGTKTNAKSNKEIFEQTWQELGYK